MGAANEYAIAQVEDEAVAAIYPMPQKFRNLRLPSFWMSYIAVNDVQAAVEVAIAHGGKVELGPAEWDAGGAYALVRDPLGAGFTMLEGNDFSSHHWSGAGARLGHGLFVSSVAAVQSFYAAVFGWDYELVDSGVFAIQNRGRTAGHLHEVPDPAVRGKEQYWAVLFGVQEASLGTANLARIGGEQIAETTLPEGTAKLIRDPDGAAFFALPMTQKPHSPGLIADSGP